MPYPRHAFFGGRTEAIQLYASFDDQEAIRNVDFTSLYLFVTKNCRYPVGHPTIITKPTSTDISSFFGLVSCTIVPPEDLYHPVLPYRTQGKLLFPLCRSCVESQLPRSLLDRSHHCPHSDSEHALTGTWCTPEIEVALAQGYVLLKVHEVWHFSHTSTSLFSQYINTFLKLKQEADGWPTDVGDDEHKRQTCLQQYYAREGVRWEYEHIERNPAKRALAKLMLNSFRGKFGQQANICQVKSITSPAKLYQLLHNDELQLYTIRLINPEMMEVVCYRIGEVAYQHLCGLFHQLPRPSQVVPRSF